MFEAVGGGADRLPEQVRVVGELAVAERRADRDEMGRGLQVGKFDLVEFDCAGWYAGGSGGLGEAHRGVFGVAHVGAVGDDHRDFAVTGHGRLLGVTRGSIPTLA